MTQERNPNTPNPATERKRQSRAKRKAAGFSRPEVPLSPAYQAMAKDLIAYTGKEDFPDLVKSLVKAYHVKMQAHQARHQCCGRCGDPYRVGGSCVFEGDYDCMYSHGGRREQEMKP